ncbi:MAG: AMIN domain-containing protein, partial [Deltaproteobacteria bacterium]|nr:AMIN domain-containing protein [Deltaproteobacteria bacterium]
MITRKPYVVFMVLCILSFFIIIDRSESQTAAGPEIMDIAVLTVDRTTEIEIKSTAPFTYTIFKQSDPYHFIVDLQDTGLGKFTDKIIVDSAGVLDITPVKDTNAPGNARLEVALTIPADIEPIYRDNTLILAFDNPDVSEDAPERVAFNTSDTSAEQQLQVMPDPAEEPIEEKQYVGEKISIDFQDVELIHVFRLIADISGYNIVVSPDVKGKFSMKLIDVPWDLAMDVILRNYGLSKTIEGNIMRVAPTAVLAQEEENIARVKESQEKAGDLVTRVYPINYADVGQLMQTIKDAKLLTKRGFISIDERTTSIVIRDVDQKHEEYEKIISALDNATPQVSINARIVEVTTNLSKELGIQWGALVKPTPQTQIGGTTMSGGISDFTGNPLAVNLPAAVGVGSGGSIGIGYIGANALRALDVQLSAAESTGKGKVISNPRIITMDNQKATIRQGK